RPSVGAPTAAVRLGAGPVGVGDRTAGAVAVRSAAVGVLAGGEGGRRVGVAVLATAAPRPGVAPGATLGGALANWQPASVATASRMGHAPLPATGAYHPTRRIGVVWPSTRRPTL